MDPGHTRTYMQNTSEQTWERGHISLETKDNHLSGADNKNDNRCNFKREYQHPQTRGVDKYKHVK